MPLWIAGLSTCRHCNNVLRSDDDVFALPPAWFPPWKPMRNFTGVVFHRACWQVWPMREQFVERVNTTDSGYQFLNDDDWTFRG